VFEGTARVFDQEKPAMDAVLNGELKKGDVVVIRYEGPKGGPGMREMLAITGAIKGAGIGKDVLLLTDGRFSGGSTGLCIGHIALVEDGDAITVDIAARSIELHVSEEVLAERRKTWTIPDNHRLTGVLGKYAKTVQSASKGAVCF